MLTSPAHLGSSKLGRRFQNVSSNAPQYPQLVSKTSSIMIELVFVTFVVTNGRAEGALVEPKRRRVAVWASLRLPQHFPW